MGEIELFQNRAGYRERQHSNEAWATIFFMSSQRAYRAFFL